MLWLTKSFITGALRLEKKNRKIGTVLSQKFSSYNAFVAVIISTDKRSLSGVIKVFPCKSRSEQNKLSFFQV